MLLDVPAEAEIASEETFGPVVSCAPFDGNVCATCKITTTRAVACAIAARATPRPRVREPRPVHVSGTEETAIALANASAYGLSASVWSGDAEKAARVARAIRAGQV